MTLVKYNPNSFKPSVFNSFFDRYFNDESFGDRSVTSFNPKVDIAETDKEFEVQLHLPGLKKNEIKIDVDKDRLTISGERKFENEKKERNFHSVESHYGTFSRSFYLPDSVNVEKIDAAYADGILIVKLPKDEKKESKKTISIK